MSLELLMVLPLTPMIISAIAQRANGWKLLGEFVKLGDSTSGKASAVSGQSPKSVVWVLRPLQGVGLSMLFAERVISVFEPSGSLSITAIIGARPAFTLASILVALLLVVLWTLDDLHVGIYDVKTGEVRMAGSFVGALFPILFGALGIYDLLEASSGIESGILSVIGITMVLYPPYCILAVAQGWYVARRLAKLSSATKSFRTVSVDVR